MAEYKFKVVNGVLWGRMPSGIVMKFDSEEDYDKAYRFEENDIIEGLAELEEARQAYYGMVEYAPYEYA